MEAIFHVRPLTKEGYPDIYSLPLDDSRDYEEAGLRIIRHIHECEGKEIGKIELRGQSRFVTVVIEKQKIPFLGHIRLGDILCSLDNL